MLDKNSRFVLQIKVMPSCSVDLPFRSQITLWHLREKLKAVSFMTKLFFGLEEDYIIADIIIRVMDVILTSASRIDVNLLSWLQDDIHMWCYARMPKWYVAPNNFWKQSISVHYAWCHRHLIRSHTTPLFLQCFLSGLCCRLLKHQLCSASASHYGWQI